LALSANADEADTANANAAIMREAVFFDMALLSAVRCQGRHPHS
jgi:hypothetical protein